MSRNEIVVQDLSERYSHLLGTRPDIFGRPVMNLRTYLPYDTHAVIVSTRGGGGRKPSRLILPGQLTLEWVIEQVENYQTVEVYPVTTQPWILVASRG